MNQGADDPERVLLELNRELSAAERAKDMEVLDRLIAEDYVGVDATGRKRNKSELFAGFASPGFILTRLETNDVRVRCLGGSAIVTGRSIMEGLNEGSSFGGSYRYIDVWADQGRGWEVVASQMTPEARA